ncbi:hypothetical protein SEA_PAULODIABOLI_235 [Microbacterium phage PauloDiaboli]|nr:hypothetical protein SEA_PAULODIABOLI_235 [Microbacterium phage PauloDiaboli]
MSLATNVSSAFIRVATEFKTLRTQITGNNTGSLAGLTTTAKGNLIAAINELDAAIEALATAPGGATINDGVTATTSVWSSSKTDAEIDAAVAAAVAALTDSAPGALDTLNELAAALGDDPNFATTITNSLAGKAGTLHTHASSDIVDFDFAVDSRVAGAVPSATATTQGKVELATDAEAVTGTDPARAVTPANLMAVVGDSTTDFVTAFNSALA